MGKGVRHSPINRFLVRALQEQLEELWPIFSDPLDGRPLLVIPDVECTNIVNHCRVSADPGITRIPVMGINFSCFFLSQRIRRSLASRSSQGNRAFRATAKNPANFGALRWGSLGSVGVVVWSWYGVVPGKLTDFNANECKFTELSGGPRHKAGDKNASII